MIMLKHENSRYAVYRDGQRIGMVELYDNPYHMKNCYVKLELERLETGISVELFWKICETVKRPLQMMVSSDDNTLTEFFGCWWI